MHGFALLFIGLALAGDPIELPKDVFEVQARAFDIPIQVNPNRRDTIERIRLFVSVDRGKTWKHAQDCQPTDEQVSFTAPKDGLYWFAVQTVLKDNKKEPAEKDLAASLKVYVNAERKALKP